MTSYTTIKKLSIIYFNRRVNCLSFISFYLPYILDVLISNLGKILPTIRYIGFTSVSLVTDFLITSNSNACR